VPWRREAKDGVRSKRASASRALAQIRYLIIDRDSNYSKRFLLFVKEGGTKVVRLPPLSANLNAFAERFARSRKSVWEK